MSNPVFVLEEGIVSPPPPRSAKVVARPEDLVREYGRHGARGVFCVVHALPFLRLLVGSLPGAPGRKLKKLVVLRSLSPEHRETLRGFFRDVIVPGPARFIRDRAELVEVLVADHRDDLLLGGMADPEAGAVVLIRGNLETLTVPFDWFSAAEHATRADFEDVEVIDSGQTLRLGDYEAATDAILYAFDPAYRRRAKANALELDDTFGGALKRLRLSRRLTREEFPGVSSKEVARIETGKVKQPHRSTLEKIAEVLNVEPEEIGSY